MAEAEVDTVREEVEVEVVEGTMVVMVAMVSTPRRSPLNRTLA